jgi:hypothetical protein
MILGKCNNYFLKPVLSLYSAHVEFILSLSKGTHLYVPFFIELNFFTVKF